MGRPFPPLRPVRRDNRALSMAMTHEWVTAYWDVLLLTKLAMLF